MNSPKAFELLERGVFEALKTYSNIHRGSGHNSLVSTHLFEEARMIMLDYLKLNQNKYSVIFCSPRGAELFQSVLPANSFQTLSSKDFGLALGVRAVIVKKNSVPKGTPFLAGGGSTKLVSKDWIIWADSPHKFEAGTPAIINVIAFARAIKIAKKYGKEIFLNSPKKEYSLESILYSDELKDYAGKQLLNELRKTLIGKDMKVPTSGGAQPFINLDNSASTRSFSPIWDSFRKCQNLVQSISDELVKEVKSVCASALVAPEESYDTIFTSNTTEAINLVAQSLTLASDENPHPIILSSFLEHSSNDLPWRTVPGAQIIRLSMDKEGFFDLKELENLLKENQSGFPSDGNKISLVSISGASNVLGSCNDLAAISQLVHQYGSHLLVDGAQLIAHRQINMEAMGIDYLAFSGHKVYAPFGAGALIARKGLLKFNASDLTGIKSLGEENIGGIAALGKALQLLQRISMDLIQEEEHILMKRALIGMKKIDGIKIFGLADPESPRFLNKVGVIPFELNGRMPSHIGKQLARHGGIGIRYGCHCAHLTIKNMLNISPFLENFQRVIQILFPKMRFLGVDRMSLGLENTEAEVDTFLQVLSHIANEKKREKPNPPLFGEKMLPPNEVDRLIKNLTTELAEKVF